MALHRIELGSTGSKGKKVCCQSKSTLGCYIVKTAVSLASNDVPYER